MAQTLVRLTGVAKTYGAVVAVKDLSLEILEGEFFTLLGPSGSGKSTTLMLIAGFEQPTAGEIFIRGQSVAARAPHKRDIGMVFQNYALFPHMTVADNVAFPLRMRKAPRSESAARVSEMLRVVGLPALGARYPRQLSGGQQQRVALARALVYRPSLLLLDEPLGALDKKLREEMQAELKAIQREIGITTLYVTHDQQEALALSDRIAIMNRGAIVQVGTPLDLYENPGSSFVAGFLGDVNRLDGTVTGCEAGSVRVELPGDLEVTIEHGAPLPPGRRVAVVVRPERIGIDRAAEGSINAWRGVVREALFVGELLRYAVDVGSGIRLKVTRPYQGECSVRPVGSQILVSVAPRDWRVLGAGGDVSEGRD